MNNKNEIVESVKSGVKYGILKKGDETRDKLKPVKDVKTDEKTGLSYFITSNEDFDVNRMNEDYTLLNLVFLYDDEEVYSGEIINYKGRDIALVVYQDGEVYLLDPETNYIYSINAERFNELLESKDITVYNEFFPPEENKTVELEEEEKEQIEQVREPEVVSEKLEEEFEEFKEEEEDYPDITLAKIGDKLLYVCNDKERGLFDLITIAFVGNVVTGQSYSRKSISLKVLKGFIDSGELKILSPHEFLSEAQNIFKRG